MYSFLVRLAHGFTLVPLILAFKEKKLFSYLKTPKSLDQILNFSKFNSGYINSGLKLLLIFSIIKKRKNKYLIANNRVIKLINKDFTIFYNQSFAKILSLKQDIKIINKYAAKLIKGWKIKSFQNEFL